MTMTRREALERAGWLLGGALSTSAIAGLVAACSRPDWTPGYFTPAQMKTVAAMADHLLPRTDTVGALDVHVDRFIDAMLKTYYTTVAQAKFMEGFDAFDGQCRQTFGSSFADLTAAQRDDVFRRHEQDPGLAPTVWGAQISEVVPAPTFYRQFKQLALVGYCTSEAVGKGVLAYDPIPGRFDACIPVSKTWSL